MVFLICVLTGLNVSFSQRFKHFSHRWPPEGPPTLESHIAPWDGAHYLHLCFDGYSAGDNSCAFYPLWPGLLRLVYWLVGWKTAWMAFMTAVALSGAGYLLFARLISEIAGDGTARRTIWLHAAAPGSLFLSTLYSEPLFFLLMMGCFLALEGRKYFWVGTCAFLLPLTRAVGVFVLAPLFWHAWRQRNSRRAWLTCTLPLLGYAVYFGLMALWTGNPLEGFAAQEKFPAQASVGKIFDFMAFGKAFLAVGSYHGMLDSGMGRGFFILYLLALPFVWKLRAEWFWWSLLIGAVPAASSSFMSYTRHVAMVFPIFVVWARWLSLPGQRWVFWYYLAIELSIQIALILRFINFRWAG